MSTNESTPSLGTVYLSASPGTPVGRFDFVVDTKTGEPVEIGTLVTAKTAEGSIVGMVVDMRTIGHDSDPSLVEMTGPATGAPGPLASTPDVMLATVQVFASPKMRPVRPGSVHAATRQEVLDATGYASNSWPIPAGVVPLASDTEIPFAPIYMNGELLLGPEAAHLTVAGQSGAAKSSYVGVLLKSILHASRPGHTVGAVLFNVKGQDLIYLDRQPEPGYEITEHDRTMYAALGIPATPFEHVSVYAPGLPAGGGARSPRTDALPLRWDLTEIWNDLLSLAGLDTYDDEKLTSFLSDFRELKMFNPRVGERIDTFRKLELWMDQVIAEAPETGMAWRSHHVATMRRIRRTMTSLPLRAQGLLTQERSRPGEDIPDAGWQDGQVIVVDIAGLDSGVQGMVIGRTIRRLMNAAEEGTLGVDHLVLVADELNTFAPSQGNEMRTVKKSLARVTAQGRYAGVALLGIAQRQSRVATEIGDNSGSRAVGISSELELGSGLYGRIPTGLTERLATLPKGQMALWHPTFRSAMVVHFPRPAWQTGKSRTTAATRPTSLSALNLTAASATRATEGLEDADVERILSQHTDPDEALAALTAAREPDMRRTALHEPSTFDPSNPFDIADE